MSGKPKFFYAIGTSYILNVLNIGFNISNKSVIHLGNWDFQIGKPKQESAAVAGLDGKTVMWTGDPASDPFCALMNSNIWDIKSITYPASTLAMGPSVDMGITATINEINAMPAGTPFAIGGYSQGAAVMSGVLNEITSGALTSRASDFLGGVTFGNPRRKVNWRGPVGGTWSGCWDIPGSTTGGHGSFPASGPYGRLTNCPDTWVDFASPYDIFTDVGDSTTGLEWVDANNLFLELLHSEFLGQFLNQFIGNFLVSKGIGQEHVTPMTDAINAAFSLAATVNEFTDANGNPFEIGGYGHTYYPALPPEGDPDNGLTSFQIALKYLDSLADEYVRSPTLLPPTSAGWASKLYPPATQWYDTPSAAAVAVDFDYGAPSDLSLVEYRVYKVDNYESDSTGATTSDDAVAAAITELGVNTGIIRFGAGVYRLDNPHVLGYPGQYFQFPGQGVTTIDARADGVCLRVWDSTVDPTGNDSPGRGGGILGGVTIDGSNNTHVGAIGFQIGDLVSATVGGNDRIRVTGFTGTDQIGVSLMNRYSWLEYSELKIRADNNATNFVMEGHPSHPLTYGSVSFSYNVYDFSFAAYVNQNGLVIRGAATPEGSHWVMQFNLGSDPGDTTNSGVAFSIAADNSYTSIRGYLFWWGENNANGAAHTDFVFGTQAHFRGNGAIVINEYGSTPTVSGGVDQYQVHFAGAINTPSLGRYTDVEASFVALGGTPARVGAKGTDATYYVIEEDDAVGDYAWCQVQPHGPHANKSINFVTEGWGDFYINGKTVKTIVAESIAAQGNVPVRKVGYSPSGWEYMLIATLPVDDFDTNDSSLAFSGRMGFVEPLGLANWDILFQTRSYDALGNTVTATVSVDSILDLSTESAEVWNRIDLVVYKQADRSAKVYIKTNGYYVYDLTGHIYRDAEIVWTDISEAETPTGTQIWSLKSWCVANLNPPTNWNELEDVPEDLVFTDDLAAVAISGSYSDLTGTPNFSSLVTTNTEQTITARKTFNGDLFVGNALVVQSSAVAGALAVYDGSNSIGQVTYMNGKQLKDLGAPTAWGDAIPLGHLTYGTRPAASSLPTGTGIFDTSLMMPLWTDGTNWRDATGTVV